MSSVLLLLLLNNLKHLFKQFQHPFTDALTQSQHPVKGFLKKLQNSVDNVFKKFQQPFAGFFKKLRHPVLVFGKEHININITSTIAVIIPTMNPWFPLGFGGKSWQDHMSHVVSLKIMSMQKSLLHGHLQLIKKK